MKGFDTSTAFFRQITEDDPAMIDTLISNNSGTYNVAYNIVKEVADQCHSFSCIFDKENEMTLKLDVNNRNEIGKIMSLINNVPRLDNDYILIESDNDSINTTISHTRIEYVKPHRRSY